MQSEVSQSSIESQFSVTKKIKQVGQGQATVLLNQPITFTFQRVNSSLNAEQLVQNEAVLGHRQLHQGLEHILLQMRVGQQWEIIKTTKQNGCTEKLLIELTSARPSVGQLVNPMRKAQMGKESGNASIKDKQYKKAEETYTNAYKLIEYDCSKEVEELKLSLVGNLALSCLNVLKFEECIKWCSLHLDLTEQPNKKIVYRKATAYKGLKQWDQAKKTVEAALDRWQDTDSQTDFKTLLQSILKDHKQQLAKEKKVYGKMFN